MVKDAMGNDLAKGDMIHIPMTVNPIGRIVTIDEGGLVIAGSHKGPVNMSAGNLKVLIEVTINFNPTQPINVFKLHKSPETAAMEKELVKSGNV